MYWMDSSYRSSITGSRETIVFPFFESNLATLSGNGLDVGCGDGELTARIAAANGTHIVGLDCDKTALDRAREAHPHIRFVHGHADRNIIPAIGLTLDYAFSNCCLCHLDDEGVHNLLMDLFSSMREEAMLVVLVPSYQWAMEMYSEIEHHKSGITAVARIGGRQHFRTKQWYENAMERCGFTVLESADVRIPNDPKLEERYLQNAGKILFFGTVARRAPTLPNLDQMKEAFSIAHDNRKLEIQLFWQRSLFFWGFVAAAFVGYGAAYEKAPGLATLLSFFGLVCSVAWSVGNRGSKYWQEYWEQKVSFLQHYTTGNIFYDREPRKESIWKIYAPRRNSVSKLAMGLSDYAVGVWLVLLLHSMLRRMEVVVINFETALPIAALVTLIYCLLMIRYSKSED